MSIRITIIYHNLRISQTNAGFAPTFLDAVFDIFFFHKQNIMWMVPHSINSYKNENYKRKLVPSSLISFSHLFSYRLILCFIKRNRFSLRLLMSLIQLLNKSVVLCLCCAVLSWVESTGKEGNFLNQVFWRTRVKHPLKMVQSDCFYLLSFLAFIMIFLSPCSSGNGLFLYL